MKTALFLVGICVLVLIFAGCITEQQDSEIKGMPQETDVGAPPSTFMDVSASEAKVLIDSMPDLIVIDVSPNYDRGHIPGAVNYYVGDGSLDNAIPTLDKNGKYLVYCHVDSAAILGAQKLIDAGFTTVYRLEGNYAAWVAAGYPVGQ